MAVQTSSLDLTGQLTITIPRKKPTWSLYSKKEQKQFVEPCEEILRILGRTFYVHVWKPNNLEIDRELNIQLSKLFHRHSLFEVIQQIKVSLSRIQAFTTLTYGKFWLNRIYEIVDVRDGKVQVLIDKESRNPATLAAKLPIVTIYESRECVICLENPSDIVFSPCGHLCACKVCGDRLEKCCICRIDVDARIPHEQRLDVQKVLATTTRGL